MGNEVTDLEQGGNDDGLQQDREIQTQVDVDGVGFR